MATPAVLLDEAFLRQLEVLGLGLRRPAAGQLRGTHRSRRSGSGMIFSDFRPYSPGDDVRHLDWASYLRLDRLVLRLFEEEADLPVHLLVDCSASMDFGQPSKFDHARRLAAALAYVALSGHDRVNVAGFAADGPQALPTCRGRNQAAQVLGFLESLRPVGGTRLLASLRAYFGGARTRGLVVLLSDFLDREGVEPALGLLARLGHEVVLVQVASPQERDPELPEEVVLVDAEDGSALELEITPALLQAYRDAFRSHSEDIEARCRRQGWTYLAAGTERSVESLVLRSLRQEGLLR